MCLKTTVKFARAVVEVFGLEYLIEPNVQDTKKDVAYWRGKGVSRNARLNWLHALAMEELS